MVFGLRNPEVLQDDTLLWIGTQGDGVLVLEATGIAANTAKAKLLIGTPVTQIIPANTVMLTLPIADQDLGVYVNDGGNSLEVLMADASAGTVTIGHGLAGLTLKTNSGNVTVSPAGNLILKNGLNFIGDTANTKMTVGLTINQGANDNEILALKSSDVAHTMTTQVEADTYGDIVKDNAVAGGMALRGWVNAATPALGFYGSWAIDEATKNTLGRGAVEVLARLQTGTTIGDCGAGANLFAVRNNVTTRLIVDAEGDLHLDAGGGAGTASLAGIGTAVEHSTETVAGYNVYDDVPDWEMARALHASLVPVDHAFQQQYAEIVERHRPALTAGGIVTYNKDGHHFIAMKKLALFQLDGLYQVGRKVFVDHEERLEGMEQENRALRREMQQLQYALGGA